MIEDLGFGVALRAFVVWGLLFRCADLGFRIIDFGL
jgi:hypothetical protein